MGRGGGAVRRAAGGCQGGRAAHRRRVPAGGCLRRAEPVSIGGDQSSFTSSVRQRGGRETTLAFVLSGSFFRSIEDDQAETALMFAGGETAMRFLPILAAVLLGGPASAQMLAPPPTYPTAPRPPPPVTEPLSPLPSSGPAEDGSRGVLANPFPMPSVGEDASPRDFLQAALGAIAAGRTGEAMEALERAESRLLSRSVRPSRAGVPSQSQIVHDVAQARSALAAND